MQPIGHTVTAESRSAFRVFAPERQRIALRLAGEPQARPMTADPLGWWSIELDSVLPEGTRYRFEADGRSCPDPASRAQPEGVHGDSAVAAPRRCRADGWRGVPIEDAVIYELHLGTFTPEGTLAAAVAKLPHLRALGVTVLELLPIAAFPGERGWGYDGTYLFALHAAYGGWQDLADFLDAAHAQGLAVLLDVVHNHFGPEGHYGEILAPFTQQAATPWGAAINLDGPYNHGIRAFFLENIRFWLEEIGFDGLRMDAVSALRDDMPVHILREATALAHAIGAAEGRHVLMIAEHLRNDRKVASPAGFGFDSQWSDDLANALTARITGERDRHAVNFGSLADVAKALAEGFVLDGTRFDRYRKFLVGTDGRATRGTEQVVYLQNHDQIGNRPEGDRLIATHGRAAHLLGIVAVMASPFVPMLFMGEEWGETAPFLFFEDFGDPALVDAVRAGRRADGGFGDRPMPDPHDRATFFASKLDWHRAETEAGRAMLDFYRTLIGLKRSGALGPRDRSSVRVEVDAATQVVHIVAPGTTTLLNFSAEPRAADPPVHATLAAASLDLDPDGRLPPHGAAIWRHRP